MYYFIFSPFSDGVFQKDFPVLLDIELSTTYAQAAVWWY
jgi:hypothetical protein